MLRALLFGLTGVAAFAWWLVVRPTFEPSASMTEWGHVLAFSALLLLLAVALPTFGRMTGQRFPVRLSLIAGAGLATSSVANVIEDGFRVEWAFFGFVLGLLLMQVAAVVMTLALARPRNGRDRLLALVPLGNAAGIVLFVPLGGVILLATWLGAAIAALSRRDRR